MIRADLHIHSCYSDGRMSTCEIAAEAKRNGVGAVALTDHDTVLGFEEFALSCGRSGVKPVKGIEVSAYAGDIKLHTLGYNFDENNTAFKSFMKRLYEGSLERVDDTVRKLNKNGVDITFDEVLARRACGLSPAHVMHVAFACADKGYCNKNPFTFYAQYLTFGKCAYSSLARPEPEETVEVIKASGGITSLAHPGRITMQKDELLSLVSRLKACGLDGIEAVYSAHTVSETAYYKEMAKTFSLMVTGGSDTHVKGGNRSIGTPVFYLDETFAKVLGI